MVDPCALACGGEWHWFERSLLEKALKMRKVCPKCLRDKPTEPNIIRDPYMHKSIQILRQQAASFGHEYLKDRLKEDIRGVSREWGV